MQQSTYRTRRWPVQLLVGLVLLAVVAFMAWNTLGGSSDSLDSYVPEPMSTPSVTRTTAISTPHASASPSSSPTSTMPVIPAAIPTELYLPNANPDYAISTTLLPLSCPPGDDIPYPHSGPTVWRAFYCQQYGLPGTDTPYYGIITGHTWLGGDTVMDHLMRQGKGLIGQTIYIKTAKSGSHWLMYRFTAAYWMDKRDANGKTNDLSKHYEVWGAPNESTAGRMVFLTCQQIAPDVKSTQNVAFVAQFAGVK